MHPDARTWGITHIRVLLYQLPGLSADVRCHQRAMPTPVYDHAGGALPRACHGLGQLIAVRPSLYMPPLCPPSPLLAGSTSGALPPDRHDR